MTKMRIEEDRYIEAKMAGYVGTTGRTRTFEIEFKLSEVRKRNASTL
jgi:hypothetical protein